MKQSDERLLALVKAAMDVVVAIGLLQLAPKKVTPRVTGAFGFITSLISCYQVTSASAFLCMCCSGMEVQRSCSVCSIYSNFLPALLLANSKFEECRRPSIKESTLEIIDLYFNNGS
jgi:hypothetical protein